MNEISFIRLPDDKSLDEIILSMIIKKSDIKKNIFDEYMEENPDMLVCPTCINGCGQCGGNGHYIKLKDLKNHPDYKSGWTATIGKALHGSKK